MGDRTRTSRYLAVGAMCSLAMLVSAPPASAARPTVREAKRAAEKFAARDYHGEYFVTTGRCRAAGTSSRRCSVAVFFRGGGHCLSIYKVRLGGRYLYVSGPFLEMCS